MPTSDKSAAMDFLPNFPISSDQSEVFSKLLQVLLAPRGDSLAETVVASVSSFAFSASLKGNGYNLRYLDWIC